MTDHTDLREALRNAASRRDRARAGVEEAMTEIRDQVRRADAAGLPRAEIARSIGINRVSLYELMSWGGR